MSVPMFENNIEKLNEIDKPIVGWFCSYVPEEVIYATGAHPFRITGMKESDTKKADLYLPNFFCPYASCCLDAALNGKYDFLDGVIFTNSCNAMEKIYDFWKKKMNTGFVYMLDTPRIQTKESERFYKSSIEKLMKALEENYKTKITEYKLTSAIQIYNDSRGLLKKISDLIKS